MTALVKIPWASPVRFRLLIVSVTKSGLPAETKPITDTATRISGKIERNSDSVSALAAFWPRMPRNRSCTAMRTPSRPGCCRAVGCGLTSLMAQCWSMRCAERTLGTGWL